MTQFDKKISVVIATYNMGQFVCQAVESTLDQEGFEIEVIVVDDGSTDNTQSALARFADDSRVQVIHQKNLGQPKAKNAGIAAATGDYIAFCDADDYWLPNKLELQIPLFNKDPQIAVVYSSVDQLHSDDSLHYFGTDPFHKGEVLVDLFVNNFIPFGTAVVKRKAIDDAGVFDESIPMGIDWDWWLRIAKNWRFDFVPQSTYVYRIWEGQMSNNWRGRYENTFLIMERFLDRNPDRIPKEFVSLAYADTYTSLGYTALLNSETFTSIGALFRAIKNIPLFARAWRVLALLPFYQMRAFLGRKKISG